MDKELKKRLEKDVVSGIGFHVVDMESNEESVQKLNSVLKQYGIECHIKNGYLLFLIKSEDYIRKTTRGAGRKRNNRKYTLDPTVQEVFDMYRETKSLEKVIKRIGCPATTFYIHWKRINNPEDWMEKEWLMEQKFFKM